jgi:hypothetical protein
VGLLEHVRIVRPDLYFHTGPLSQLSLWRAPCGG